MTDFTLTRSEVFPDGTEVTVHEAGPTRRTFRRPSGGRLPAGNAIDSETMADGQATFTGLGELRRGYVAVADVDGEPRYVRFTAP